jgi:hypothetical protein
MRPGTVGKPRGRGNVRRWKPLPSNGSDDVTGHNRVCARSSEM